MNDPAIAVHQTETATGDWLDQLPDYAMPERGEIVDGTIVFSSDREVRIDIGGKSEGMLHSRELERMPNSRLDELEVGQHLSVYVVNPLDREGNTIVSLTKAEEEKDWQQVEEFLETQDVIQTQISGFNRGGVLVNVGHLRGFVPGSQLDAAGRGPRGGSTPEDRWGSLVGQPIHVRVIELDRERNRLILSERAAMRDVRRQQKEQLLEELQEGDVRSGRVVNLARFGAFVDLGGADGLVHLSELAWGRVNHPQEVVEVGDEVEVYVLNVDREQKRIGLSIKRLQPDPWWQVEEKVQEGSLIEGNITKLTDFGAFASVGGLEGIEGLIHVSELSDEHIEHPKDIIEAGQKVTLRVISVDSHRRRLGLSLRAVTSDLFLEADWPTQPA